MELTGFTMSQAPLKNMKDEQYPKYQLVLVNIDMLQLS